MTRRADIARRRWISSVVDYAITCRTGSLTERIGRGMDWVHDGVEVYAQHGSDYHTGRRCSCAGCYQRDKGAA